LGEAVQILDRPLEELLADVRRAGEVLDPVVDLEDEGARELPDVVQAALRAGALDARDPSLPCRGDQAAQEAEHDERARRHGPLVTPRELGHPVAKRVRARQHRQAFEVTAEVVGKVVDRRETSLRLLAQRLQDDGVQVAAQLGRRKQWPHGVRRSWASAGNDQAGRLGLSVADGPHDDGERILVHLVRTLACQQLVEQHAQGVHVAGRRHGSALHLLGARVLRGQHGQ